MGRIEFQKLPINTMVGASWRTFKEITGGRVVDKGYRMKYFLTKLICRILSLLNPIEDRCYRKMLADKEVTAAPVFVLGHWRSGTTFVHNVLSRDPQFGYNTTYQTVFPNLMLWGQSFFKKTMAGIMPDKRPTDNMELHVDLPQEEEFALTNMIPCTFYNFWFYPRYMQEYCDKYLLFEKATQAEKNRFKDAFLRLIKISLWNTKGNVFLSKNPPHTGRIPQLLEMFPDAKFVYLMRNPYTVFESTRSYFTNTIQPLKLQDFPEEEIEQNIIETYSKLYHKYQKDKVLIPEGNLIEIRFEDFEVDPLGAIKNIYETLSLDGYETSQPLFEAYLATKKGYKKNKYKYADQTIDTVNNNWKFAVDDWGYEVAVK